MKQTLLPVLLFASVCFVSFLEIVKGDFEDVRCICVCPPVTVIDGTSNSTKTKKVYRMANLDAENCKCEYVLTLTNITSITPKELEEFCLRCECQYESRSTTTIKVVVIMIICVVAMLFVYMLFLLILDPLMNKRRAQFRREDELDIVSNMATGDSEEMEVRYPQTATVVDRVRNQQQKWKGQVEVQRRHIFDRHTMLN